MLRSSRVYIWVFLVLGTSVLVFLWTQRAHLESSLANVAKKSWVPRPIQSLLTKVTRANRPVVSTGEIPAQRAVINAMMAVIDGENLQQCIENMLTNGNQFSAHGYGSNEMFAEVELEQVLACRRAVRVLNTFEKLPEQERIQECKKLFDRSLRVVKETKYANMDNHRRLGARPNNGGVYKFVPMHVVCLAMFATAETGRLDVLADQFRKMDEFQKQVEKWSADIDYSEVSRKLRIESSVPDSRFQLNVIRLAVARNPKSGDLPRKLDSYCQSKNLRTNEIPVVAWDARTTWFEGRSGSRMDVTKGVTTYFFYNWRSHPDDERREIAQKVREMVF